MSDPDDHCVNRDIDRATLHLRKVGFGGAEPLAVKGLIRVVDAAPMKCQLP